mgnify:CR=1 FL=1
MNEVSAVRCASYDPETLDRAMAELLAPIGGLDWVRPGMTVAVKANLVTFMKPDAAATTHPEALCALVRLLKKRGAEVVVGDSPGGLYNAAFVQRVYAATGMQKVEAAGARLNQDFSVADVHFPEGRAMRSFTCTAWLQKADAIIDFCKLKSHGMMTMSAAVKNLFGTIPGTMKPEYHFRFPEERDFADMLVDLNEYFRPRLSIADAVVGMEGNGPTAGTPRPIGALLASKSPYALDLACAEVIGVTMNDVPTLRAACERGLAPADVSGLTVYGDLTALKISDFQNILSHRSLRFEGAGGGGGRLVGAALGKLLSSRPKVKKADCAGCGLCARICPAKAIQIEKKLPHIDRGKCIRCFCCQEFCPKGAMKVHRPPVARLLVRDKK